MAVDYKISSIIRKAMTTKIIVRYYTVVDLDIDERELVDEQTYKFYEPITDEEVVDFLNEELTKYQ